jgi:hypothetical protein
MQLSAGQLYEVFFGNSELEEANDQALRDLMTNVDVTDIMKHVVERYQVTPLQEVSHQEWLEAKAVNRMYRMCYAVLDIEQMLKDNAANYENWTAQDYLDSEPVGLAVCLANEALLIRDMMNESE